MKKRKIEVWPDGRAKMWYATFSTIDGTISEGHPLSFHQKECMKMSKDGYTMKLIQVFSMGGWDSPKEDQEEVIAIYDCGEIFLPKRSK